MLRSTYTLALLGLSLVLALFAVGTTPAVAQKGTVKKGVYTSPAKNFSVPLPKGMGMKVSDAFQKDRGFGAVSFHDDFGNLLAIHYLSIPAELQKKIAEGGITDDLLYDWLHNFVMPVWFKPASPESRILVEANGTFEEHSAVFALIDAPGGSSLVVISGGKTSRADSRRAGVVFIKGRYIYLLARESLSGFAVAIGKPKAPDDDWMKSTEPLKSFYKSISFTD